MDLYLESFKSGYFSRLSFKNLKLSVMSLDSYFMNFWSSSLDDVCIWKYHEFFLYHYEMGMNFWARELRERDFVEYNFEKLKIFRRF